MTGGSIGCTIAVWVAGAVAGCAGLVTPPWRGQANTTFADWQFLSETPNPLVAEQQSNPAGLPTALIMLDQDLASGWYDSFPAVYGSAAGFWDIGRGGGYGGAIALTVPHPSGAAANVLTVMVQVVYWDDISDTPTVQVPGGTMVGSPSTSLVEAGPSGGGWYAQLTQWTVAAGWDATALVKVEGHLEWGSVIDRIVVDTRYAAPEPPDLGLAGMDNGQLVFSWPLEPAGYRVTSCTNLLQPSSGWLSVTNAPVQSNGVWMLRLTPGPDPQRYYRLETP
jgi:hypothetical protein